MTFKDFYNTVGTEEELEFEQWLDSCPIGLDDEIIDVLRKEFDTYITACFNFMVDAEESYKNTKGNDDDEI